MAGLILVVATDAAAEADFTFAGRVGVSIPYGDAFKTGTGSSVSVAENSLVSVPLQLDAGVTLAHRYFIGAYGQYRFGILKSGVCPEGFSCSETGARAGLQFQYSFTAAKEGLGAWMGLGSGWEWMFSKGSSAALSATVTLGGWEFAILQVGFDAWLTRAMRMGYYISGSVGQYSRASVSDESGSLSGVIPDKGLHYWIEMGFKTTFEL